jgi:hypothetical protein
MRYFIATGMIFPRLPFMPLHLMEFEDIMEAIY